MQQLTVRCVPSLLFLIVGLAHAQTMEESIRPCACSTAAVRALTLQLVETQTCLFPDQFVTATAENLPGVDFTGRAIPLLQRATLDALSAARARLNRNIGISSAFRPLSDQYALYNATYREEGGRRGSLQCGCLSVAPVGTSDHQSGRAVDLNNYENVALRREMTNAGCRSIVVGDRPHFECPGQDAQNIATLAFQHLWNLNNPDEPLVEDGFYGEGTKQALARAPANGFPIAGCRGALVAGVEACNERDDDFDGQIDEGLDCSGTCVAEAVDGAEDALFKDLPPGQFGFEEAALLRRAGITTGCQPNPLMFCPRCLTTRAQMVTFVVRALGVDLAPYRAGRTFEDVSPMSTYHPYIEAAADLGITIGCGPTTFCPDDFVTREKAATFIVRPSIGPEWKAFNSSRMSPSDTLTSLPLRPCAHIV